MSLENLHSFIRNPVQIFESKEINKLDVEILEIGESPEFRESASQNDLAVKAETIANDYKEVAIIPDPNSALGDEK